MIDADERDRWFKAYLRAAIDERPVGFPLSAMVAWARSMSKIAEQFVDDTSQESVDA